MVKILYNKRKQPMNPFLISKLSSTLRLPPEVVKNIIELDVEKSLERSMSQLMFPSLVDKPSKYNVRLSGYDSSLDDTIIQYYDRIDSSTLKISRREGDIESDDIYNKYRRLLEQGGELPPITVIKNLSGDLVSLSHGRTLIAQEYKRSICAWIESESSECGSKLTLGEFNVVKKQLESENHIDLNLLADMGFDVSRIWYHGTAAEFEEFDLEKFGTNESKGDYIGKGIFFASNIETALKYSAQAGGDKIMKVFLKMGNCLNIPDDGLDNSFYEGIDASNILSPLDYEKIKNHPNINRFAHLFMKQEQRAEFFKSKGYDGFIEEKSNQAGVLSADQIFVLPPEFKLENKIKPTRFKL